MSRDKFVVLDEYPVRIYDAKSAGGRDVILQVVRCKECGAETSRVKVQEEHRVLKELLVESTVPIYG